MTALLLWLAYGAGYLFTYRRIHVALDASFRSSFGGNDAPDDRAMTAIFSLLLSLIWPLVIVGYAFWCIATPVTPGQRKAELDARERRIRDLERELGIDRKARP